jgi:hypothetical protein
VFLVILQDAIAVPASARTIVSTSSMEISFFIVFFLLQLCSNQM